MCCFRTFNFITLTYNFLVKVYRASCHNGIVIAFRGVVPSRDPPIRQLVRATLADGIRAPDAPGYVAFEFFVISTDGSSCFNR